MSHKLRAPEYLTAAAALTLFISTFWPWFSMPSVDQLKDGVSGAILEGGGSGSPIHLNVWDLHFGRWFIYLALLCAAWLVIAAIFSDTPEWALILATPTVAFSGIAMLTLLYRLFDAPRATAEPAPMFYVALAGATTLFAGACWSLRDESVPSGFAKAPTPEVVPLDSAP
jgi:hypothetical protein